VKAVVKAYLIRLATRIARAVSKFPSLASCRFFLLIVMVYSEAIKEEKHREYKQRQQLREQQAAAKEIEKSQPFNQVTRQCAKCMQEYKFKTSNPDVLREICDDCVRSVIKKNKWQTTHYNCLFSIGT
jgi:hypothetical protein